MRANKYLRVLISALLVVTGVSATGAAPQESELYILKFVDNVNLDNEIAALKANGVGIEREYRHVFKGAAVRMNAARAEALARNPRVEILEKDGVVTTQATQDKATWGLDRIDQNNLSLDKNYNYNSTGDGVNVYVVDTGIDISHKDFGGRATWLANFAGGSNSDCNGHGTHVAGTIGSTTYGVAKLSKLFAVKVLNCAGSGTWSGVISGLDFVGSRDKSLDSNSVEGVVNMSLGGGADSALDAAVEGLIAKGFVVVVAAGNSNVDAGTTSPARTPNAITVGATTSSDSRASFSNYGASVDLFAPGNSITSTWPGGRTKTISGTSMAAPHVAGVVARYLQGKISETPTSVASALILASTKGVVSGAGTNSPNRLLFWHPSS